MDKIPFDIIREHILPYTYQPQPSELCRDIRNFYIIRHTLLVIYRTYYLTDDEDIEWLTNDIDRFMNADVPMMFGGLVDQYIEFFKRLYMYSNCTPNHQISAFVTKINDSNNRFTECNVKLALMKPDERIQFCHWLMKHTDIGNYDLEHT
jgi:hypothetical protein